MNVSEITPIVLTYDEAPNIGRCLGRLENFTEVIVVDSGSTDRTIQIVAQFPNATVVHRDFDSHAAQWNFGLAQAETDWVLCLDADYLVPDALLEEIGSLQPAESVVGFRADFEYCILGRPLRRSVLPPRSVLFRRRFGLYTNDGHTQRLQLHNGETRSLANPIAHDDRKSLERWLWAQGRYARLEVVKLRSAAELSWPDRVPRLKWLSPIAIFLHVLLTGGVLDGWRGLYYAQQRMIAEAVLSLELIEAEIEQGPPDSCRGI